MSKKPGDSDDAKKVVLPTVKKVDINYVSEMAIVFTKKMQFFEGFVELFEQSKYQLEAQKTRQSFLEVYYKQDYEPEDNPNKFSWNVTRVSNDTIYVKLNFTEPELVSQGQFYD